MKKQPGLNQAQIQQFIHDGFIRIDHAFPATLAEVGRNILWQDTGCHPDDPTTWTKPVVRLGFYDQQPFRDAANTPLLHTALDQLVGQGFWKPRTHLGTFPVRFPHPESPGDDGWHVDGSFPGDKETDFSTWRINIYSHGRALLMLFLFSDIGEQDAPTRIRVGSHLDIARLLEPAGEKGMSFMEVAGKLDISAHRSQVVATGAAGTVYLCHPFLVHAAQSHHGTHPRFLAQPSLELTTNFQLHRNDHAYSPVETAIRLGLGLVVETEDL